MSVRINDPIHDFSAEIPQGPIRFRGLLRQATPLVSSVGATFWLCCFAMILGGCGGGMSAPPPPPPATTVTLSQTTATVDVGTTLHLTATTTNDPKNSGVTWSFTGGGSLNNQTSTSVTYTGPTTAGSATVTATAVADNTKSAAAQITIAPLPQVTPPAQIPPVTIGQGYSLQLAVTGGTSPFTWGVTQGQLPKGLTLDSQTGLISGTAQLVVVRQTEALSNATVAATNVSVTVQVADSSTPRQFATLLLNFIVNPAVAPLQITTSSLRSGGVNVAYSAALAATGGTPPYTWSATGLPSGLAIDPVTGVISGTPTASGNSNATFTVHDAATPALTTSANLTISILSRGIIAVISENSAGVPSKGTAGILGTLQDVVLSQDGRYAAFVTSPAALISPDAKFPEVYWHDSCLGASNCSPTTILASATNSNTTGTPQEGNGGSFEPTISADGNYVGFLSQATNLDPQTAFTPKLQQIYIRKICNGNAAPNCTPLTSLADINLGDDAEISKPVGIGQYDMDANADHIVFNSSAMNVLPTVPIPGLTYVEDTICTAKGIPFTVCTPKITIVSADSVGRPDNTLAGIDPVVSEQSLLLASGRFAQITPARTSEQVFVQGTCVDGADTVSCLAPPPPSGPTAAPVMFDASVDNSGRPGSSDVLPPFSISATGRFLAFSDQDALAPNSKQYTTSDVNTNIYLRDTCHEAAGPQATSVSKVCGPPSTTTISVANDLSPANNLTTITKHAVSADGRLVVFTSRASNLAPNGPNGTGPAGMFIRDTCRNAPMSCMPSTVLVSVDSTGAFVPVLEGDAVISADGHYCAFTAYLTINGSLTTQIVLALTGF